MSLLISPVQYFSWTGQVGNFLGRLSYKVKDWTLFHARGFIKRSAILSAMGIYLKMIFPDLTYSLTKWYFILICFVCQWFLSLRQ